VPAAAVIRRIQALSGITGRKELRRWHSKRIVKSCGSTIHPLFELLSLSMREVDGISSVGVKSVDIRRNTDGVGSLLAHC
jgi:hypothetical protein